MPWLMPRTGVWPATVYADADVDIVEIKTAVPIAPAICLSMFCIVDASACIAGATVANAAVVMGVVTMATPKAKTV